MKSGIISLYWKGDFILSAPYDSVKRREVIIEGWQKQYAGKFFECDIHICPDCDPTLINEDGTNKRKHSKALYPPSVQVKKTTYYEKFYE